METTQPVNTDFTLTQVVDFNADRVNFNQLLTTANGSINVLAMKAGQKLDRHFAPMSVAVYVLEGAVDFTVEQTLYHLVAGKMVMMEGGTPHAVQAIEDSKILLIKIAC